MDVTATPLKSTVHTKFDEKPGAVTHENCVSDCVAQPVALYASAPFE